MMKTVIKKMVMVMTMTMTLTTTMMMIMFYAAMHDKLNWSHY